MTRKTPRIISRFSEVILSLGIPATAYLASGASLDITTLLPKIALILLGAWHVIVVNDDSFAFRGSFGSFFLAKKHSAPKLLAPALIIIAAPFFPVPAAAILATILFWDIYSLRGKCQWLASLLFNFLGGATHFLIGLACASATFVDFTALISANAPETLFFALAMVSGAMHHESYDIEEDRAGGYASGAVRFSPNRWWRLACLPLSLAVVPLFFTEHSFKYCFLGSTSAYFALYAAFAISEEPYRKPRFRILCRLVFVAAAAAFAYLKTTAPPV